MDRLVSAVETILRRHPAPGLPLSAVLEELGRDEPHPGVKLPRLRALLEARPDRFRVLELWGGVLHAVAPASARRHPEDAWVAVLSDPADAGTADLPPALRRLRSSVRWLARTADPRSTAARARWHRLLLAEAQARRALAARTAEGASTEPARLRSAA